MQIVMGASSYEASELQHILRLKKWRETRYSNCSKSSVHPLAGKNEVGPK